MTLYPDSYGTSEVTLERMVAKHGPKMHPEFARRFFAYIEHKGGSLGVGGGWRSTQPNRPGFAPDGKSFHQDQRYASGFVGYAAVDLVHTSASGKHRSPSWAECADAPAWGLHTFIDGEPWHLQCVEMRGWGSWKQNGSPDPDPLFVLPGQRPPVAPIEGDHSVFQKLVKFANHPGVYATYTGGYKVWVPDPETRDVFKFLSGRDVEVVPANAAALWKAMGPVLGPVPDGADAWGLPA